MDMDTDIINNATKHYLIPMRTVSSDNLIQVYRKNQVSQWYAIYTRPQHEKKIYTQLREQKINAYLPLQTTIRQWSDRKKKVDLPLFSCYLFVHITLNEYYKVLNIPGVIRFITFEGKAVKIPERQIQVIKDVLSHHEVISEITEPIYIGSKIRVCKGPLTGIKGELIEFAGKKRVIIRIEEIGKYLMVNIPLQYLKQEYSNC